MRNCPSRPTQGSPSTPDPCWFRYRCCTRKLQEHRVQSVQELQGHSGGDVGGGGGKRRERRIYVFIYKKYVPHLLGEGVPHNKLQSKSKSTEQQIHAGVKKMVQFEHIKAGDKELRSIKVGTKGSGNISGASKESGSGTHCFF